MKIWVGLLELENIVKEVEEGSFYLGGIELLYFFFFGIDYLRFFVFLIFCV